MAEDKATLSIFEHDLHHGGEVSLILGIHGLEAPVL